jgi:hypothetical protein
VGLKRSTPSFLLVAVILLAISLPLSLGQAGFSPCRIVNLDMTFPVPIEAGRSFTIDSSLTVACWGFLPLIRIDIVDANSYQILSTAFLILPYSYSGSYVASMTNNATARNAPGSWALVIQAYVIDRNSGYTIGRYSQLFQVVVSP